MNSDNTDRRIFASHQIFVRSDWLLRIDALSCYESIANQQPIRAHENLNFSAGVSVLLVLMSEFQDGEENRTNQSFIL